MDRKTLTANDLLYLANGAAAATGEFLELDVILKKALKESVGPRLADCFLNAGPYPDSISILKQAAIGV